MAKNTSINIAHYKISPLLEKYIREISAFKSKGNIKYSQKLTSTYLIIKNV